MNILKQIVNYKIKEIARRKKTRPLKSFVDKLRPSKRDFKKAIRRDAPTGASTPRLIAELKKASPSNGLLRPNLENELADIVKIYNQHATAISVVTDQKFFQGSLDWIKQIRPLTNLPILCKDFIIDEYQIYEARRYGADAVLLLPHLSPNSKPELKSLAYLIKTAYALGMHCLVEIHNKKEIKTALMTGAEIIGINNRNLTTFKVNLQTTIRLAKILPTSVAKISESGFHSPEDINRITPYVDAVLIGTIFMQTKQIKTQIQNLGF